MDKIRRAFLIIMIAALAVNVFWVPGVRAAAKDMEATKRSRFKDDASTSFNDAMAQKAKKDEAFRQKILNNDEQVISLLMQIRDQLVELNAKTK